MNGIARLLSLMIVLMPVVASARRGEAERTVDVRVTVDGEKDWLVEYRLPRFSAEWTFDRSQTAFDGGSWRTGTYRPDTAGVRIVSRDGEDRLVVSDPATTTIRLRVTPYAGPLRGDNQPAVRFSNGALAIYPGQFIVSPAASGRGAIRTRVTVVSPGSTILAQGRSQRDAVTIPVTESASYLVIGGDPAVITPDVASIVDPGLPDWIRREVADFVPRLLRFYHGRLGRPAVGRPSVLVAWGGSRPGSSFSGSVFDDMVVLDLAGSRLADPDTAIRRRMRFFLAHETAHFWMGHTLRHRARKDAWISEGGAEAMATEALTALDPQQDREVERARLLDECVRTLPPSTPLERLAKSGGDRAVYACGAAMYFAAAGERSVLDVISRLLAGAPARSQIDGRSWLAKVRPAFVGATRSRMMRRLIMRGLDSPQVARSL